jgi:hypothetical protein
MPPTPALAPANVEPSSLSMSARTSRESEFEFTLTLDGIADLTEDIENALFAAGCDDATISAESGRVIATFCRSAPTMTRAIMSAVEVVRRADVRAAGVRIDGGSRARPKRIRYPKRGYVPTAAERLYGP